MQGCTGVENLEASLLGLISDELDATTNHHLGGFGILEILIDRGG